MWTREQLKANAKYVLSFSYWKAFLACLVVGLICGVSSSGSNTGSLTVQLSENYVSNEYALIIVLLVLIISLLALLYGAFVANPIIVGQNRFFIANRQNKGKFDQLFSLFKGGIYGNTVKVMFLKELKIVLWSLLFVIPGIIKAYEYLMVPYILAENPNIDSKRAFQMSRDMMKGEKWDTFVLELSFLGWTLLGVLACGIGSLFVAPYMQATFTELYEVLKYKVISCGQAHPDELGGQNGYMGEERPAWNAQPQRQYPPVQNVPFEQQAPAAPSQESSWFEEQVQSEQQNSTEDVQ